MFRRILGGTALTCLFGACSSVSPATVSGPTTVRPGYALSNLESRNQGAIFRAGSAHLLFEQQSARYIGDIVKIEIAESLSGSNKSGTSGSRKNALKVAGPGAGSSMTGLLKWIFDIDVEDPLQQAGHRGAGTRPRHLERVLAAAAGARLVAAGQALGNLDLDDVADVTRALLLEQQVRTTRPKDGTLVAAFQIGKRITGPYRGRSTDRCRGNTAARAEQARQRRAAQDSPEHGAVTSLKGLIDAGRPMPANAPARVLRQAMVRQNVVN